MVSVPSRVPAHLPPPRHGLRVRMSYEEFLVWSPDNMVVEWKDGEAIVFMPATSLHQQVIARLFLLLGFFVRARDLGVVRTSPLVAKLWPGGPAREPDILFISHERLGELGELVYTGGPDLLVEVISQDSVHRDREEKREEYARAGVREYWMIESREGPRLRRSVTVYRLDENGQYGQGEVVRAGIVHSTVLPGFWMPVEWLWQVEEPDPQTIVATILRHPQGPDGPEAPEALYAQPWVAPILQEGRAEGLEIGIAQGRELGRAEGLRTAIRTLVTSRFGRVPRNLEHILQATTREEDLTALLHHVLSAPEIDDLTGSRDGS